MSTTYHRKLGVLLDDFERAQKTWKELNGDGVTVAQNLVLARTQASFASRPEYWLEQVVKEFPDVKERYLVKMIPKLEEMCNGMQHVLNKMLIQYGKMSNQVRSMSDLLLEVSTRNGLAFAFDDTFYSTCTMETIVDRTSQIYDMYTQETLLKRHIVETLCAYTVPEDLLFDDRPDPLNKVIGSSGMTSGGGEDYDECMGLLSMWLYEPNLITSELGEYEALIKVERQGDSR